MALLTCSIVLAQSEPGRPATDTDIKAKDLTVLPNGAGLPKGHGDAKQGSVIFKDKCAVCHNEQQGEGRENQYPALAGGIGSVSGSNPKKTVGSYWPYATTLFDYVRRAMPYDHPRSLSTDEVYSVRAFVLYLSGIGEGETGRVEREDPSPGENAEP